MEVTEKNQVEHKKLWQHNEKLRQLQDKAAGAAVTTKYVSETAVPAGIIHREKGGCTKLRNACRC